MSPLDVEAYGSIGRYAERFDAYDRYRPSYPSRAVDILARTAGLGPGSTVADIGSGTGLFTAQLLDCGFEVFAVEPSSAMASAAQRRLGGSPLFHPIAAPAERTGLPDRSVDAIACAQSFHWFRVDEAIREFTRILRPGGAVAFLWNRLSQVRDDFHVQYAEALRTFCEDIASFGLDDVRYSAGYFRRLFPGASVDYRRMAHGHLVSCEQLIGRTASLSSCPPRDTAQFVALAGRLERLHREYRKNGVVRLHYDVDLYCVGGVSDAS